MEQTKVDRIVSEIENSNFTAEEMQTLRSTVEQSQSSMTLEQYQAIMTAIDHAQNSTRPFIISNQDELAVAGDANDTKINPYDYEITFRKPVFDDDGNITGETTEVKEYKNIYITPRKQTKIQKLLVMIMPYFQKEDGEPYTKLEMLEIFSGLDETLYDYMYDLVAYLLNIPEEEKECMTLASVIGASIRFMFGTPEAVNEANAFFDSSPDKTEGTENAQSLSSLI